jgi:SAM-dependent methyltransferase/uncharacterized protein YndB with AHSA1/START domain
VPLEAPALPKSVSETTATVRAAIELDLEQEAAFEAVTEALTASLARRGLRLVAGVGGLMTGWGGEVARVVAWEPPRRLVLEWLAPEWESGPPSEVELSLEPAAGRIRVTLEHRGWGRALAGAEDLAAWFAGEVAAPLLAAAGPAALGDWLTDRIARLPEGATAREIYADPLFHYPNFRVILAELAPTPDDVFLDVGCGGGALLRDALRSGCRAAGVDHSPDMARLARELNQQAIDQGRLEIHETEAEDLPFLDSTFTCAAMTGVLGFLPDPVAALAEIHRVLQSGGRFIALGSDPEMRGTPAAPEPVASRLRFYDDDELAALGRHAGFEQVEILRRPLDQHAREVGVPEELLPLFAGPGPGARFLLARKD